MPSLPEMSLLKALAPQLRGVGATAEYSDYWGVGVVAERGYSRRMYENQYRNYRHGSAIPQLLLAVLKGYPTIQVDASLYQASPWVYHGIPTVNCVSSSLHGSGLSCAG